MSFKTRTKLLFIHNPKTGGDFIRKNLGEYTYTNEDFDKRKHEPFTQFAVEGYKPWCVVRNPYTRLESHYNYMKFRDRELCDIVAPTFEQFVLRVGFNGIPKDPFTGKHKTRRAATVERAYKKLSVSPQVHFCQGIEKKNILKFERLTQDLEWFFNTVHEANIFFGDEKFKQPVNMSPDRPTGTIKWSQQMRKVVNKYYKHDFRVYNYKIVRDGYL